ncbi:MAG: S9 family peptidase [Chloroflexi bacterium]|nr:S9 family peptidase [Chloroflexota bacterium]
MKFVKPIVLITLFLALTACASVSVPRTASLATPTVAAAVLPTATRAPSPTVIPTAPPLPTTAPPALIPRRALFALVDKTSVSFSRDGTKISYLAPFNNALNVWVAPVDKPNDAKPVTSTNRGTRTYLWAYTNNHVLYLQDLDGDENYQIYAADLTTGSVRTLTPRGTRASIHRASAKFPREILISLNERDAKRFDLYRANIETGDRALVLQNNEGFDSFTSDDDFVVRFATKVTSEGGREIFRRTDKGTWESFTKIGLEDESSTYLVSIYRDGKAAYMVDSRGRNTGALTSIDLATGAPTVLAQDVRADISGFIFHPTTREMQAVAFTYDKKKWFVLDSAIQPDLDYLDSVAAGEMDVVSRTLDDKRWVIAYSPDDGPTRYYLYDRAAKKATFLFSNRPALENLPLAKMHATVVKSRDGLDLVSYFTLPLESNADGALRPLTPLPMILLVHGGPWSRDAWGYNLLHQWLANRGYVVLSVNFRGSDGFGKSFLNAGNLEWAGKMHDDLIDSVEWAVREGIADPKKICIMGGSYGGYATLVGLTFTPDVFACGASSVGPSSLVTLMQNPPPYWSTSADVRKKRVGDHTTEEGRAFLLSRSPLTFVEQIKKPLLIQQGGNDPRVKQSEADQIVKAMQAKTIPATYLLYPNEGHGFQSVTNSRAYYAVVEQFLASILGGRAEPLGDDLKFSSITVPVGFDLIPGLREALGKK